jgi:hypothetical protein
LSSHEGALRYSSHQQITGDKIAGGTDDKSEAIDGGVTNDTGDATGVQPSH